MDNLDVRNALLRMETWARVLELDAKGWGKNGYKKFLWKGSIPAEYRLPLALSVMNSIIVVVAILIIASRVFSFVINIVLVIVIVICVYLPNIMVLILSRKE